jgi:hypothetical protein
MLARLHEHSSPGAWEVLRPHATVSFDELVLTSWLHANSNDVESSHGRSSTIVTVGTIAEASLLSEG